MTHNIYNILSTIPHNKHYLARYIKFINQSLEQNKSLHLEKIERHHICPSSLFSEYKSFNKHPWNQANLTPRQHFIAHWILWKTYSNSMTVAFFFMSFMESNSGKRYRVKSSRVYEKLRNDYRTAKSQLMSERRWYTDGTNDIYSDVAPSDLFREGRSNMSHLDNKDTLWYNDGKVSKKFRPGDEIPRGWSRGRVMDRENLGRVIRETRKGKKWYTNGESETLCLPENKPDGWRPGRQDSYKKSMSNYKHSDEAKKKISETHKGVKKSRESIEKRKDVHRKKVEEGVYVSPRLGKKHSSDTKKLLSDRAKSRPKGTCVHCGATMTVSNLKKYHNDNCKRKPTNHQPQEHSP